jgi:sporulation protein YlmC with PRC-barrel domain
MTERGRLDEALDAGLMLLDRQILDHEGRMVAKVDDVELVEGPDTPLAAGAILTGSAALVPRLGGAWGGAVYDLWLAMGRQYADRGVPGWIDLSDVEKLDSSVHLRTGQDGVIARQPERPEGFRRHRLGELLGMPVHRDGRRVGKVIDVRLDGRRSEVENHAAVVALVVGRGRPGARLGYDRHPEQGPRLISLLVHALHRHQGLVAVDDARIDWEAKRVDLEADPKPLRGA